MFEARQNIDYKELVQVTMEEASEHVRGAREFIDAVKKFIQSTA